MYTFLSMLVGTLTIWNNLFISWMYPSSIINLGPRPLRLFRLTNKPGKVHHHVAFLKVHKTGSSTIQSIFLRFGFDRNLTFVVPSNTSQFRNVISVYESVVPGRNIIPPPKDKHYDILCFHAVYNRTAFERIMPIDTKYIGIIREPFLQFDSTLRYFQPKAVFEKAGNISTYLKNPYLYESKDIRFSFTNNRMAYEFGFPSRLFKNYNSKQTQEYLKKLDKEFDVVIVNEYMEESVVLLRRILNWKVKDILYLTINENERKHETDNSELEKRQLYRQYAKLDYALYEFFLERLWRHINFHGQDILREISYFKSLTKTVQNFCLSDSREDIFIEESPWSEGFSVVNEDCEKMDRSEVEYVDKIVLQQYMYQ